MADRHSSRQITTAASVDELDRIDGVIIVPFVRGQGMSHTPHIQLGVGEAILHFLVDTGGGIPLTINAPHRAIACPSASRRLP